MLKRIFWAVTITIPLYLSIALESSSTSGQLTQRIVSQPQHLIAQLKERFAEFQQELEQAPSVKSNFSEQ